MFISCFFYPFWNSCIVSVHVECTEPDLWTGTLFWFLFILPHWTETFWLNFKRVCLCHSWCGSGSTPSCSSTTTWGSWRINGFTPENCSGWVPPDHTGFYLPFTFHEKRYKSIITLFWGNAATFLSSVLFLESKTISGREDIYIY